MNPSRSPLLPMILCGAALLGCGARSALVGGVELDAGAEPPDGAPDGGMPDGGVSDGGTTLPATCEPSTPPPSSSCGPLAFTLGTQATCAIGLTGAQAIDAQGTIETNQCGACAGIGCTDGPVVCARVLAMKRYGTGHVVAWCDSTTLVKLLGAMNAYGYAAQSAAPKVASIGSMFPCPPHTDSLPGATHLGSALPPEYEQDPTLLAADWDAIVLCGVPEDDGGQWQKTLLTYVHDLGKGVIVSHDYQLGCNQTEDGPMMDLLTKPMGIAFLPVHVDWAPLDVDLSCVADYVP